MPYLPTSQSYLEQSSLLLQAYPDTRITTKYTFPTTHRTTDKKNKNRITKPSTATTTATPTSTTTPIATLTLKTFNPTAGICLKYRTNKAAEVGRLVLSLGKLAAGADLNESISPALAGTTTTGLIGGGEGGGGGADVEMVDVVQEGSGVATPTGTGKVEGLPTGNKGGKGKKKGGKGKR